MRCTSRWHSEELSGRILFIMSRHAASIAHHPWYRVRRRWAVRVTYAVQNLLSLDHGLAGDTMCETY